MLWVVKNKLRVTLGASVEFEKYIDYSIVQQDDLIPQRISFLDQKVKREVQSKQDNRYTKIGEYNNR